MNKSKGVLEAVVSALVQYPEEVGIEETTDEMGVLLTLKVSKHDMGRVIGKEGNTAKALRTLLRAVGMTEEARINLVIAEPEGSERAASGDSPS